MFERFGFGPELIIAPIALLVQFAIMAAAAYVGCTLALRRHGAR